MPKGGSTGWFKVTFFSLGYHYEEFTAVVEATGRNQAIALAAFDLGKAVGMSVMGPIPHDDRYLSTDATIKVEEATLQELWEYRDKRP